LNGPEPLVGNAYEDTARAEAYASLAFPGTYYLAFRDLPGILAQHVAGRRALDFGCGAGRSTRFLRDLGFHVTGADVAAAMLEQARRLDPDGSYMHITDGDVGGQVTGAFDLVLAAYPFDNIAGDAHRVQLMRQLRDLLAPAGRFVLLASTPELYVHEWLTFTTAAFPENRVAGNGDPVRIVIREGGDARPIDDLLRTDDGYRHTFARAGLDLLATYRPLGRDDEPFDWVNETRIPPWVIYVTGRGAVRRRPVRRPPAGVP
jgi:SAM-dependent methyltransferase